MTTYRVRLADGSYAERVSKSRRYVVATTVTVGAAYQGDDVAPGTELVLAWHTTREAASRYLQSRACSAKGIHYRGGYRFATVEAVEEEAPRKATCVNAPTPVDCLHKQGTPTKGSTMNKHRVILANGVEATRNSANRVYTHATVVTAADGDEGVLSWHMTKASGDKYIRSAQATATAAYHQGTLRQVEVELLPKKVRKAPSAKVAEPVVEAPVEVVEEVQAPVAEPVVEAQEAPAEAPVEEMPASAQDVAQEAAEAPAQEAQEAPEKKKQTTRMLKVECPEGSGYKVRLARSWLDSFGAPSCPCHGAVMVGE